MTESRPPDSATNPLPPFVFRRLEDAYREAQKQRAANQQAGLLTRVEPFSYGKGYVVRSVPIYFLAPFPGSPVSPPGAAYLGTSHPGTPYPGVPYPGVAYPVR